MYVGGWENSSSVPTQSVALAERSETSPPDLIRPLPPTPLSQARRLTPDFPESLYELLCTLQEGRRFNDQRCSFTLESENRRRRCHSEPNASKPANRGERHCGVFYLRCLRECCNSVHLFPRSDADSSRPSMKPTAVRNLQIFCKLRESVSVSFLTILKWSYTQKQPPEYRTPPRVQWKGWL